MKKKRERQGTAAAATSLPPLSWRRGTDQEDTMNKVWRKEEEEDKCKDRQTERREREKT